jgi:Putative adhesin
MKTTLTFCLLFLSSIAFAQQDDFHLDKEYAIDSNGTIDLNSSDADVLITGTARGATARVKIDRVVTVKGWYKREGSFTVNVNAENGNLIIREQQSSVNIGIIGYYNEDYKILIEAPEGVSLTIRGDDGDYVIKNIDGAISMNFDDGNAQLTNCDGDRFSFRLDDGDIRMNKGKGSLDVVADDADVEILNAAFSQINARLDDGDFIVHTSLENGGDYSIDTEDGMVFFDILSGGGEFSIRHDDSSIRADGDFKVLEETESFKKLTLGSGSARIKVRADDASVKLIAK